MFVRERDKTLVILFGQIPKERETFIMYGISVLASVWVGNNLR